eukprot:156701-Rhodomonas_salina.1
MAWRRAVAIARAAAWVGSRCGCSCPITSVNVSPRASASSAPCFSASAAIDTVQLSRSCPASCTNCAAE